MTSPVSATLFLGTSVIGGAGGAGYGVYKMVEASGAPSEEAVVPAIFAGSVGAIFGTWLGCGAAMGVSRVLHSAGTSSLSRALRNTDVNISSNIPAGMEDVATGTRTLIQQNRDRLNGTSNNGYQNYPDFTEIGTIRANEMFIDEMRASGGAA